MTAYQIRKMDVEDITQVQHVAKTSWNDTYKEIIPSAVQERFLNSAYSDDMLKRRMAVSELYVVETEGTIVGYANFSKVKDGGEVELGAIYLLPEYQGLGFGSALLQNGIQEADAAKKVFINVEKDNRTGMNFYEAKGFKQISEFEDDLDGHKTIMVRMVLHIN